MCNSEEWENEEMKSLAKKRKKHLLGKGRTVSREKTKTKKFRQEDDIKYMLAPLKLQLP